MEETAIKILQSHPDYVTEGFSEYQNGRFNGIIEGLEFQKQLYSEEEVWKLLNKLNETLNIGSELTLEQWFEQFKKK